MVDLAYPLPSSQDNLPAASWSMLKLCDNGDGTLSLTMRTMGDGYANLTSAVTQTLKTGAGVLRRIMFNKLVSLSTLTAYDNTAGSGTKICSIALPLVLLSSQQSLEFGCAFSTGLTIVTTGTSDITVVYS